MFATGIGSLPGEDAVDFTRAVQEVFELVPDLPFLPELPHRGAAANMTGRALALIDLGADLQPAGWRLTDAAGVDQRRARSLMAQDLDTLEEHAQDYAGPFKIQVAGPWTLAATVEKPRGDRVLSDFGARRELAEALADGIRTHVRDVRRRLPKATELIVQIDEPALALVMAGKIPTASGFSRHRSVDQPVASQNLEWVTEAIMAEGATPVVHSCAANVPIRLLRGAGFLGVSVDLGLADAAAYDLLAETLDEGGRLILGLVPTIEPPNAPTQKSVIEGLQRWLDMLGLDPDEVGQRIGVSPTCGLAGASLAWSRTALKLSQRTAAEFGHPVSAPV
jgi:methionine synthase II (cobalamin-independent)